METTISNTIPKRYGIIEKKKSDIDSLSSQVIDATAIVQQQSSVVAALSEKSVQFQNYLIVAENSKTQSQSNKNGIDQVVQNAYDLSLNSDIAFTKMSAANENTKEVAKEINILINKLIYSVEIINKLSNLVIRKKALNPLISDDLISKINTAGTDANNAVALTLIALKSIFASQTSCFESEAATALEQKQSLNLYFSLTGRTNIKDTSPLDLKTNKSIQALLYIANEKAIAVYNETNAANTKTTELLNSATTNLNKAQINLSSLQAALAAANAAALAS